jgi:3-hydroxybutyryl-CoA dehydrogenase
MNIQTIGIVGAGQMGSGIAQVASHSGFTVLLMDVSSESLEKAIQTIKISCEKLIKKNRLTEQERDNLILRISCVTRMEDLKDCDLVIEAASEQLPLKLEIFKTLDCLVKKTALLVSNTSSISLTKIASVTTRPELVCGMHFMNPVPVMALVEGIRALQTSDETFNRVRALAEKMGKTWVASHKDMPGFIVNRILMPMINEAIYTLYEGIGTAESIDEAMRLGTNQPMGPLALADFIGLDTCLSIMKVLYEGFGQSQYSPCPLLVKYVEAGWLGRKTGQGFYTYSA